LPGQSGLDFQRDLAAASVTLPIVFITGHGDIPMSVRAMKAGAVEFLTKRFRDRDLLDAIHQAIQRDQAALQRRLVPDTALQPTDLAERVGVDLPTVLEWIAGRREPSSSQFGRLIAALDPAFIVDVYGDDVEAMRHRFEDALTQSREAEARARAALEILRGGTR